MSDPDHRAPADIPADAAPPADQPAASSAPANGESSAVVHGESSAVVHGESSAVVHGEGSAVVVRVKVLYSNATEVCACPPGLHPAPGDLLVVPTRFGNEIARVLGAEEPPPGGELKTIVRAASPVDLSRLRENGVREEKAWVACRQRIEARGLDMKLVSAHYLIDEQKILFLFTAENRVDFRDLVRDLVAAFKLRIELRQIGVRDEARVVGGVGTCGRVLCCNAITDRLRPVSIKMAKEQNLTLNSLKISGHCGRLLCCLAYEYDAYREARQSLPPVGARLRYDGEEFRVADLNVLARRVRLESGSGRVLDVGFEALVRGAKSQGWEVRPRGAEASAATPPQ